MKSLLIGLVCFLSISGLRAQDAPLEAAVPEEPITAIVEAFRKYPIVALGDNHGSAQAHAFRLSLVRDPRFAAVVNDIVVEFGNARYQSLMDRFIRGEDVAP